MAVTRVELRLRNMLSTSERACIAILGEKKEETGPLHSIDGVILTDDPEKGEPLNSHLVCLLQRERCWRLKRSKGVVRWKLRPQRSEGRSENTNSIEIGVRPQILGAVHLPRC